jgi:hypothetical protein
MRRRVVGRRAKQRWTYLGRLWRFVSYMIWGLRGIYLLGGITDIEVMSISGRG